MKAYTIALEVLGRDDSFDPQIDPVVRMEAGRLRQRLERYYVGAGQDDPVRIEIPKGGYVPTFSRHPDGQAGGARGSEPARGPRSRGPLLGLLGLAALAVVAVVLGRPETAMLGTRAGPPAPQERGPALIVLPFESLADDEADEVFAGGLTEELIANLMRFSELRLYSAYGSFLEPPTADPVEFGERLDVGYVVKGSVRRGPDHVRLIVHLIEARSGQHLWAETYERALTPEGVFSVQEQLAADLASQLAQPYGIVQQVTAASLYRDRPETLFAYDCVLRAFAYRRAFDPKLYPAAHECLERAVRLDPGYAEAWALLAYSYLDQYRWAYGPGRGDASVLDLALDTALHATELDPEDVYGLLALSTVYFYRRGFDQADEIHHRVLSLNPTNPEVLAQVGWRTAFGRNWDEGIALLQKAIDRSIKVPGWYLRIMAWHYYRHRDYQAALADANLIAEMSPSTLAVIYGQLGRQDEARRALDQAIALDPQGMADPRAALRVHNVPEDLIDQLMAGLIKAGCRPRSIDGRPAERGSGLGSTASCMSNGAGGGNGPPPPG